MKVIAEHWDQLGMLAFLALGGIVLIVKGVRGLMNTRGIDSTKRGGTSVP